MPIYLLALPGTRTVKTSREGRQQGLVQNNTNIVPQQSGVLTPSSLLTSTHGKELEGYDQYGGYLSLSLQVSMIIMKGPYWVTGKDQSPSYLFQWDWTRCNCFSEKGTVFHQKDLLNDLFPLIDSEISPQEILAREQSLKVQSCVSTMKLTERYRSG